MRSEEKLLKINQASLVQTSKFAINPTNLKTSSSTLRSPPLRSSILSPDMWEFNSPREDIKKERVSRLEDLLHDYDVREQLESLGLLAKKRLTSNDITKVLG